MQLYPSILSHDPAVVREQLNLARQSDVLSTVQIDVIDGMLMDNLTLFPSEFNQFDFGNLTIDFHLLTTEPLDVVYEIMESQLPVRSVIAQIEQMTSQPDYCELVSQQGWRTGLSLNVYAPLEAIETEIWPKLDIVQIMGNEAGFQGKELHPSILTKIEEIADFAKKQQLELEIIVDIGVKLDTVGDLAAAGATGFVVGSGFWQAADFNTAVSEFQAALTL